MKLFFINGKRAGEEFEISASGVSLGRELDNDISILDGGFSRHHARIEYSDGIWRVIDLKSTNGVFVNGTKVEEKTILGRGDEIRIGSQVFRFGESAFVEKSEPPSVMLSATVPDPLPGIAAENSDSDPFRILQPDPLVPPANSNGAPPPSESKSNSRVISVQALSGLPESDSQPADTLEPYAAESRKEEIRNFFDSFAAKEGNSSGKGREMLDKIDIFSGGPKMESGADGTGGKAEKRGGYRPSSLLFYVAVIGIAVIVVSLFIMFENEPKRPPPPAATTEKVAMPLLLVYEKEVSEPDNVFRFYLKIEEKKAEVVLDDLKFHRHFSKEIPELRDEQANLLSEVVKRTNFMTLPQEAAGVGASGKNESRTLTIGYDNQFHRVEVRNNFAPSSFEKIEASIEEFCSEVLGVPIVFTVEEMKANAEQAFGKAEHLFMNWKARPDNLKEAIKRYRVVTDSLETFVPKPEMWDVARKKCREAETLLEEQIKSHTFNAVQAFRVKNYQTSRDEYAAVMAMLDPDDPRYEKAREKVIGLDEYLRTIKQKK